ncbi:MAG: copper-binding protein [Bryobacterales bacterium]|nr:copper-binding protein [Bryobacterales bacterium]
MRRRSALMGILAAWLAGAGWSVTGAGAALPSDGNKGKTASGKHRRYPLTGVVRSLVKEERLAMIRHQEIPGWMPAMTMEFEIRSAAEFAGLDKGMTIRATVVVTESGAYWLENVTLVE